MKRLPLVLAAAFSLFSLSLSQPRNDLRTSVRLMVDAQGIAPGARITAGILMRMEKGWHTYWKSSGEAGLPTTVRWTLPEGFTVGEIEWPVPTKEVESGDVLTYGYKDETMLLIPITAPRTLRPGSTVTLKAQVDWLECEATCVPGSAAVAISLPVTETPPRPANAELFSRYRSMIPQPLSGASPVAVAVSAVQGKLAFTITPRGGWNLVVDGAMKPDLFPEPLEQISAERTSLRVSPSEAILAVPLTASQRVNGPLTFRGVIVFAREGGDRQAVQVEVPLSTEFCSSIPAPGLARPPEGILDQEFSTAAADGESRSLALYLLFAVIGGLLLNVMPCVLPVIALKVFGLVRMAGDKPLRVKTMGWVFSLGILASFLALALLVILLQAAGERVGWGFQFQEPLFVVVMSAVVFAFGLSLFGVYEIRLPGVAVTGASGVIAKQEVSGKGYAASFFEGVFATILATPCTAPFLGSALGFAFAQPWWMVLLIFASVAVGMALPYLLLTSRPGWLRFVPKPGAWMESLKQFMGFLMMATVLWLLYILGNQLGMEAVIWVGSFLLAVGVACWALGRFATLTASRTTALVTWGLALVVVVAGYVVFVKPTVEAGRLLAGQQMSGQRGAEEDNAIAWEPFSRAALEQHLASGKLVFIDFTAEWCLTCKVNEKTVLSDAQVVQKFRSSGVLPIKADWTSRNPEITELLAKFGRSGVPLYVVFPAGRPREPIVLPEVITPSIVIGALEKAGGS